MVRRIGRAGLELIARDGYANVTVPAIAREAGVATRTVTRYFPLKEDFLLLIPRENRQLTLEAMRNLSGDPDPLAGMVEQSHRLAGLYVAEIPFYRLWTRAIQTAPEMWGKVIGEDRLALEPVLAGHVAAALGVDPAVDPRPVMLAGALLGAHEAVNRFAAVHSRIEDTRLLLEVMIGSLLTDIAALSKRRVREDGPQPD